MNIKIVMLISMVFQTFLFAEKELHHDHLGETNVKLNYEFLDFENSKKKTDGKRYGIEFDHQDKRHHYQLYYEKSDTKTTALLPIDLEVHKYALKYSYALKPKNHLTLSYISIDDNIMKETDGGHIYGLGYKYKALTLTQYLSDYENFNVYQTDIKLGMKKKFNDFTLMIGIIAKYIRLQNNESNNFTKKANTEYFTTGLKLHVDYEDYHASVGTYQGTRIFAVMNDGLRVQHHSMEFQNSYFFDVGKKIDKLELHLRYARHNAKEVPIGNDGVRVETVAFEVGYAF